MARCTASSRRLISSSLRPSTTSSRTKGICVVLRSVVLLCRVDELHPGSVVGLFAKWRLIDSHENFDGRIGNKFENVTTDRTSVWLAQHSVHMDYGHTAKNRDVSDKRHDLDLLLDRNPAVRLLRNVEPSESCTADRTDGC